VTKYIHQVVTLIMLSIIHSLSADQTIYTLFSTTKKL